MSNPSRQDATWSATSPRDTTAVLCHITGVVRPKSCQRCQTGSGVFDKCVVAPSGHFESVMAGKCSNCFIDEWDKCIWDGEHCPASERETAELPATTANSCIPPSQPTHDGKPGAARNTAHDDPSEPQECDYPGLDELSDSSYIEEQSDEELAAEDGGLTGNENPPSHQAQSQPLALTRKTIPYDEVYKAARDPEAIHKHCRCPACLISLPWLYHCTALSSSL